VWLGDRRRGAGGTAVARARRALAPAVALGLVALAFALPWYVRSWQATGNPVFPELYRVFGPVPGRWDPEAQAGLGRFFARFGYPRTLANQLLLPWHVTMHAARFSGTPGPLLLALAPLAALGGLTRAGRWVLAFALCYLALWASPLASFQFRWLVAALPALAVVAAHGYARLLAEVRPPARGATGRAAAAGAGLAVTGLLALQLPAFTRLHMRDITAADARAGWLAHTTQRVPLGVLVGAESRDAYLARNLAAYRAWRWSERGLPPGARVLVWGGGDHFYSRVDRVWVFAAAARPTAFALAGDERAALAGLRRLGVTHLLIERRFLERNGMAENRWDEFALTTPRAFRSWYEPVYQDGECIVYRVRDAARLGRA
jgi:hypothetical protein